MSIENRIVEWNEERGLIKTPSECNVTNNMSFIIEEVIEAMTNMKSDEARENALVLANVIRKGNLKDLIDYAETNGLNDGKDQIKCLDPEQVVDAAGDIVVFSIGIIRKLGYNPELAMNEVLKEIESRVGSNIDGKFTKDKSEEAKALWYKADFSKAKIL